MKVWNQYYAKSDINISNRNNYCIDKNDPTNKK